ncbi:hypothetical protein [Cytobacillus horneckiae]
MNYITCTKSNQMIALFFFYKMVDLLEKIGKFSELEDEYFESLNWDANTSVKSIYFFDAWPAKEEGNIEQN